MDLWRNNIIRNIIKKGTKLYSIIHPKCPKCQEGNLFFVSSAYNLKKMLEMPDNCLVCHEDFKIEPGFYTGALWISYPIVLIILIPLSLIQIIFLHISFIVSFIVSFIILMTLQPLIMRYSRAIWLNFFVTYENRPWKFIE